MDQIPDWIKILGCLIGIPIILYWIPRWMTMAAIRSFFEIKQEFENKQKETGNKKGEEKV